MWNDEIVITSTSNIHPSAVVAGYLLPQVSLIHESLLCTWNQLVRYLWKVSSVHKRHTRVVSTFSRDKYLYKHRVSLIHESWLNTHNQLALSKKAFKCSWKTCMWVSTLSWAVLYVWEDCHLLRNQSKCRNRSHANLLILALCKDVILIVKYVLRLYIRITMYVLISVQM